MKQYLELMKKIRDEGTVKHDRTGVGTTSLFGEQMRFDLAAGLFPLVTTKLCHLKSIIHELLWFLQGETNIRYLKANGVSIWDSWIDPDTAVYEDMTLIERLKKVKTKDSLEAVVSFIDCYTNTVAGEDEVALTLEAVLDGAEVSEDFTRLLHDLLDIHDVQLQKLVAGDLGPVYGSQWRKWEDNRTILTDQLSAFENNGYVLEGHLEVDDKEPRSAISRKIDQIAMIVNQLRNDPDGRRIIVSAWNPSYVDEQALPPCHSLFQFYSAPMSIKDRTVWTMVHCTMDEKLRVAACIDSDFDENNPDREGLLPETVIALTAIHDELGAPTRKLSCQLYQRKSNCALVA